MYAMLTRSVDIFIAQLISGESQAADRIRGPVSRRAADIHAHTISDKALHQATQLL